MVMFSVSLLAQTNKRDKALFETGQFSKLKRSDLADVTRVISESEIRLRGANNLKDILMMETGGIFTYDLIKGWQFQWHGSTKGNILILMDGLPFRSVQFDENDLQQIPLDNISRIEITESPQGVAYGSSAIMGVINIISKSTQTKVYKPSLRFQSYSPGSFYTNLNMGRRTTENFFRFSSSVDAFGGMQGNDSGRVLQWLPYTRVTNQFYYSHKVLQYMDLSIGFNNLYENKTQLGYPYPQTVRAYDREIKTNNNTIYAGLKGKLTRIYSVQGDVQLMNYSRKNTLYLKDIKSAEQKAVNDTSLNDTIRYNYFFSRWVLKHFDVEKKFSYLVGFDVSGTADKYKPTVANVHQTNTTTGLFGNLQYRPLSSLIMNAGFRLPYSSKYRTKPLWDVNLNYTFTSMFRFKLLVARSTKAPTFDQLFATYLTNGYSIKRNLNLTDESVISYHYSLIYRNENWMIEPGFFSYSFKDGIELIADKSSPGRLVHKNFSKKRTLGTRINIEGSYKYLDLNVRMILTGNNHLANLDDNQLFHEEVYSNITLKVPRLDLNLCYVNKLTTQRGYMVLDAVKGTQTSFNGRYYLADLAVEKSFSKKTITIRAGLKNMFNVKNIESFVLPASITGPVTPRYFTSSLAAGRIYFFELNINL
jgi:outer membrane receptor for ferrienterochelin and colicins